MKRVDRRRFLKGSLLTAASLSVPWHLAAGAAEHEGTARAASAGGPVDGGLIDVNVDLFNWPFRTLKYGETPALVEKLRKHRVQQAWAGSNEALFHKNIDAVNARLAEACAREGDGVLVPFGTVNPAWPDWEEDLRRCQEVYHMPGVKLFPNHQNYTLDHPAFAELIRQAADRGMVVLIAIDVQDERMRHPRVDVEPVDVMPLAQVLPEVPHARVVLVNPFRKVRMEKLQTMVDRTNVRFGISNLDGNGGLERVMAGTHWYLHTAVPAERLVFGSHMPYRPLENVLFRFMESEMTEQAARAIMAENAAALLQRA